MEEGADAAGGRGEGGEEGNSAGWGEGAAAVHAPVGDPPAPLKSLAAAAPPEGKEGVWASLRSGKEVLGHHMEEAYLASLSQCVEQGLEEQGASG